MAQCPSCGAGLTKKEMYKTVHEANPQPVYGGTVMYNSYYKPYVPKEVLEVTYECMFCGNVYEEWELQQKKESMEMNGLENDIIKFPDGNE